MKANKPANNSTTHHKESRNAIDCFKEHSNRKRTVRQLDDSTVKEIATTKLPFTAKKYYAFAEKYLPKSADEDLYQEGNNTYYREIITNDDELKILQFVRQFFTEPILCDARGGIGNMLHFASLMGYTSFGYDINTLLQPIHEKIGVDVTYGNLLDMDLKRLKTADVVYLYRPINNRNRMKELLKRIYEHTKEDVIVIYNYPHMKNIEGFETILLSNYDAHILMLVKKIIG